MAVRRPRSTAAPSVPAPSTPARSTPAPSVAAPATPGSDTFTGLGLPDALVRALAAQGVTEPFPIQAATLPDTLAGRDVLGRGRTGSGKTYAFALPVLARLAAGTAPRRPGRPRALILAPTRELATQIEAAIAPLARALSLRTLTVFGGVGPAAQIRGLRAGVDIVVACPGRLADHLEAGHAHLDAVEITVLDEADHMADLGFLPVVRRLMDQTPRHGQRLLFSATLDGGVDVLVRRFLAKPITHSVDSSLSPVAAMAHHVLHVSSDDRLPVLIDLAAAPGRTLVFARTKRGARVLARRLVAAGVPAVELHGNLAQAARSRNLQAFASGSATTLVATDIAARGIHVDEIALVIHADPPAEHKAYLHRSGRTARAGASGTVVTLMTDAQVRDVRALARQAGITPETTRLRPGHPLLTQLAPGPRAFVAAPPAAPAADRAATEPSRRGRSRGRAAAPAATVPRTASSRTASSRTASPRTASGGAAAFSTGYRGGGRRSTS
ncbi:DEAD/DEAH box helicase [Actinomycetes bacterium KLBMP 9797]